jgi:hypothetical protein
LLSSIDSQLRFVADTYVSHQIMISTLAVNLSCESMSISTALAATIAGYYDRESNEYLAYCPFLEPASGSEIAPITV